MRDKRQEMIHSCCDYVISEFEKQRMKEYLIENRNEFVGKRKEFLEFAKEHIYYKAFYILHGRSHENLMIKLMIKEL